MYSKTTTKIQESLSKINEKIENTDINYFYSQKNYNGKQSKIK